MTNIKKQDCRIMMVGVSVRAMINSAERAGIAAHGIDFFGDMDANRGGKTFGLANDLGMEPSITNLLTAARQTHGDDYLLYFSGLENSPEKLEHWRKRGLLLGNNPDALQLVRNPLWVQSRLQEIGETMPEFYSMNEAPEALDSDYLLKPINRGGGHGIKVIPAQQPWRRQLQTEDEKRFILQRYCPGQSASFTFLGDGKKSFFIGSSSQWSDIGSFRYRGNMAPLYCITPELRRRMENIAQHLTAAAGLVGLNTVDIILEDGEMYLLEVNPRWSASVELFEMLMDTSLFSQHVGACFGKLLPIPDNSSAGYAAKTIVYAKHNFTVNYPFAGAWNELYEKYFRDLPRPGTCIKAGNPLCTALATGETTDECMSRLAEQERWVSEYFAQYGIHGAADTIV